MMDPRCRLRLRQIDEVQTAGMDPRFGVKVPQTKDQRRLTHPAGASDGDDASGLEASRHCFEITLAAHEGP